MTMQHKFADNIPDNIEYGCIYISMKYKTAIHLCACGCGEQVVTRFSPKDWTLTFDGVSISLSPSIGNWGFKCRSHYWIIKSEIVDASKWERQKSAGQNRKKIQKKWNFFSRRKPKR